MAEIKGANREELQKLAETEYYKLFGDDISKKDLDKAIQKIREMKGEDRQKHQLAFLIAQNQEQHKKNLDSHLKDTIDDRIKQEWDKKQGVVKKFQDQFEKYKNDPMKGDATNYLGALITLAMEPDLGDYTAAWERFHAESHDDVWKQSIGAFSNAYGIGLVNILRQVGVEGIDSVEKAMEHLKTMIKKGEVYDDTENTVWKHIINAIKSGYHIQGHVELNDKLIGKDDAEKTALKQYMAHTKQLADLSDHDTSQYDVSKITDVDIQKVLPFWIKQDYGSLYDEFKRTKKLDQPSEIDMKKTYQ